jgi:hypothetical protein
MSTSKPRRRLLEQLERRDLLAELPISLTTDSDLFRSRETVEMGPCLASDPMPVLGVIQIDPHFLQWKGGNVDVKVMDGVLVVRGDAASNYLTIEALDASTYKVTVPLFYTKLNGVVPTSNPPYAGLEQTFSGVTSLDIDLGAGDDSLRISGAAIQESTINLGEGNDQLILGGITEDPYYAWVAIKLRDPVQMAVQGNLTIDGGAGNDEFIPFARVQGNALVQLGAGDDSFIELVYPTLALPVVHGNALHGPKIRSELVATGSRTVDLGADQEVNEIPADWRQDPRLKNVVAWGLPFLFGQLDTALETGSLVPSNGVTNWFPSEGSRQFEINADGRMRVQFMYLPGFGRVMDRLRERGVQLIDANSNVDLGSGEAWIHGSELAKFANLPGLIKIDMHGSISYALDYHDPTQPAPMQPITTPEPPPPYVPPGGNVTAEVIQGVLTIRGDAKANKIQIVPEGNSGGFTIQSPYRYSKINGELILDIHRRHHFAGVTSIDIDLGDGDDEVAIFGSRRTLPSLSIRTGNGSDYVRLGGNNDDPFAAVIEQWIQFGESQAINGDVFIDTGDGDDLFLPFAHVNGDVNVQMGAGNDSQIALTYNAQLDPDTGLSVYAPYSATFTAEGAFVVDLGDDQDLETLPPDWRSDLKLVAKIDYEPQVWPQISTRPVEIEFSFLAGDQHFIERLQARGLQIDAYTVAGGLGRAKIRDLNDFRLFANLPSLARIQMAGTRPAGVVNYPWDYERTSELIVPGPAVTGPIQGPPRLEDFRPRGENDPPQSLLESYYGTLVFGPRRA